MSRPAAQKPLAIAAPSALLLRPSPDAVKDRQARLISAENQPIAENIKGPPSPVRPRFIEQYRTVIIVGGLSMAGAMIIWLNATLAGQLAAKLSGNPAVLAIVGTFVIFGVCDILRIGWQHIETEIFNHHERRRTSEKRSTP